MLTTAFNSGYYRAHRHGVTLLAAMLHNVCESFRRKT